ncbi:zf-TFIIB domain-containing protein [Vulcanococcus limneticus Candia 3F8]|uniref:TFIIB-type zinc ribbon-containing protein n=1 Tax=Vulcanococcus limneticus TaxID=2170428 RepID=UPI000B997BBA|nr:zf-TFIIB domain-containing protein [Vulcanococcus limneticus]MCP9792875.1 zf-TFIIB domain-containing protein [Vulcanococcus limneticus MW73D5]MCP9894780.1 zf-TFIIB domain-containing protein [Vulcanococcus limneticus Candia 3F8]MCP9898246.1 zf-TFIIB domain-containing protein [Vulcanococcus limneticus Candia 3B3]
MNCPGCSAPLPASELVCRYCGSRLDVDLQGWAQAEVTGSWADRHCPDCRCPLDAVRLEPAVTAGSAATRDAGSVSLGRCPTCLGMFLGTGGIETLLSSGVGPVWEVNRPLLDALGEAPRTAASPSPVRYRPCPCCGELMNRNLYGKRSGVIVDRCAVHGFWLDAGELRQLLEWSRAGGQLHTQERLEQEQREQERRQRREDLESEERRRQLEDDGPRQPLLDLIVKGLDLRLW